MAGGERVWLAAWLGIAVLGGSAVSAQTPAPAPRAGWLEAADRGLGDALAPGELARAHASLSGVASCTECHAGLDATPDERCIACHADVGRRMQEHSGYHGSFQGACASCHGEHRGPDADLLGLDRKAFNHELARFPLRGAHSSVRCAKCHTREGSDGTRGFHPIGIEHGSCAACHDDVHGEAFLAGRECATCHSPRGFGTAQLVTKKGKPAFDHGRDTEFPLTGRHAAVPCAGCHDKAAHARERARKLAPGRGAARECASCHSDPHEAALGTDCDSCHRPEGWTGGDLHFDHARDTAFALDATHAALACASCHSDRRFGAASTHCEGCHTDAAALLSGRFRGHPPADADPHHGKVECAACHRGKRDGAPLVAAARACVECHAPEYGALLLSRQRIVDGLLVEGDAALRALPPASGEDARARELRELAAELDVLGRSGAHHPALAETIARELRDRLRARAEVAP